MIRKPNRLKYYDYSLPGYYFLTICTKKMKPIFGKVINNSVVLSSIGKTVLDCLLKISLIYRHYTEACERVSNRLVYNYE